ncbi:MAG: hypothetical protein LBQ62_05130 [Candidatus Accumulibacter sp.]|nr:hypothetical protein [Accumulibacter sp.]
MGDVFDIFPLLSSGAGALAAFRPVAIRAAEAVPLAARTHSRTRAFLESAP